MKQKVEKVLNIRLVRFLIVGGSAAFIDLGINSIFVAILTISPARESIIAKLVSSSIAMVYNFTLSRKWTFKSTGQKKREQFIKFSSLTVFNYILSSLILGGIVYIIHSIAPSVENEHSLILNDSNLSTILSIGFKPITLIQIIANLVVIIVFAVWNYYLYKKWIFKD